MAIKICRCTKKPKSINELGDFKEGEIYPLELVRKDKSRKVYYRICLKYKESYTCTKTVFDKYFEVES